MFDRVDQLFESFLHYGILVLEIVGALVIFYYTAEALIFLLRGKHQRSRDTLAEGISTGLGFLLGSEVLKTIIAPDWTDIGMTCAILVMRAAVTLLVHWEKRIDHLREENAPKETAPKE